MSKMYLSVFIFNFSFIKNNAVSQVLRDLIKKKTQVCNSFWHSNQNQCTENIVKDVKWVFFIIIEEDYHNNISGRRTYLF